MVTEAEAAGRLKDAPWLKNRDAQAILALLDGGLQRTRAVGGVVRDTLMASPRDGNGPRSCNRAAAG